MLVIAIIVIALYSSNGIRSLIGVAPIPTYRLWTPGTMNGVEGQYHMVAIGITKYTANQLLIDDIAAAGLVVTQTEFNLGVTTLATGTIVFYFRATGDDRPFQGNEALYLRPTGDIKELTFADTFALHKNGTITVPCIDHNQLTVCNNNTICTNGTVTHGGITSGDPLTVQIVKPATDSSVATCYLVRTTATGTIEYLVKGQHLCPYNGSEVAIHDQCRMLGLNAGQVGGPTIPIMTTGTGDVFNLEPIA
ncbi:MAG: hypothetical protein WC208_15725 [Gallionella sp.]